ncbi:TIGR03960 family B12-binding radical SAM protein [Candidatus Poribacteria bacterium]|nr:TIGR03960 family B12-binding radical SAM protein [Candidatus Poribacteria bacterium]
MNKELLNDLVKISKPTRYLGDELNVVKKDSSKKDLIRFALAFPDIYDIGMSHLGLKILYHILNNRKDVWAERVYTPWIDMEEYMRSQNISLSSLESSTPIAEFDIVGFSLQYELSYTNILNMLDLGNIPLLTSQRDEKHPLIIAGGPCAFNPEPLADFIDFFVIGDGEEIVNDIIDCYKKNKNTSRKELLEKMAGIEGIYVPSLVEVEEQLDGFLAVSGDIKIKKRAASDLNQMPYPVDYMLPFMRPVHDRAVVEVMRGCSRGCRFCQAGMIYRPVRERSTEVVSKLTREIVDNTGYEEISLSSLSTCDHSTISEIMQQLVESPGKEKHVSISLPSLRTDAFSVELARSLESIGKTGLTFAPEVATNRMQSVINKNISKEDVFSTVRDAFSTGWDSLKLYFMIGLPTENDQDVENIGYLSRKILNIATGVNKRASINVSISTFIPKAHTPFQWERQLSTSEVEEKQRLVKYSVGRNRRINISFNSPEISLLEGAFARGDRKLGKVLHIAHKLGCKLDGWTEMFNYELWLRAFNEAGVDPREYLKPRNPEYKLPWDHIDTYLTKDFLLSEREKAYEAKLTPDCRWGSCSNCGVCDNKVGRSVRLSSSEKAEDIKAEPHREKETEIISPDMRIRFMFVKGEEVRFISHLNMINAFTRAFRRADIPIAYSHGFNPHPKISFGSVLPVNTTSEAEYADVELELYMDPEEFMEKANNELPPGLKILSADQVKLKEKSLMSQINMASYEVKIPEDNDDAQSSIESILNMEHVWVERRSSNKNRGKRSKTKPSKFVDIRPLIRDIKLIKNTDKSLYLKMLLSEGQGGKAKPEEIVRFMLKNEEDESKHDDIIFNTEIHKTGTFIEHKGKLLSPVEIINQ